ncbi:MAG: hypothetical protein QOK34_1594 [Gaiellaceae bacterium]|jgi:hypothetical protein|nr:hypothetical protein [Gaiellaceae bacterium]
MKGIIIRRLCDGCGDQANYTRVNPNLPDWWEDLCEECARNRGAESNGKACAAFETIGFAVSMARGEALTDSQIRAAFDEILTAPHSEGDYPIGGDRVLGPCRREDRPWARTVTEVRS